MRAIVAVDRAYGIGKDGGLLRHVSADLKRFKQITTGGVVIYGRNTLDTFPGKRALPGRENIMLTKNAELFVPNVQTADSLERLFELLDKMNRKGFERDRMFVIGGGSVYEQLLPFVSEVLITRFADIYEADRHFPNLDENEQFRLIGKSDWQTEGDVSFCYETWRRVVPDVSMKEARKIDWRILSRQNPGDALRGSLKQRRAALQQVAETGRQSIYAISHDNDEIGYVLFAPEIIGADAASAVLHSRFSLSGSALTKILSLIFDEHPGLYSLVLSADQCTALDIDQLPDVTTTVLPGVSADRVLLVATRPNFSRLTVGFYPFELGLVALQSDGEAITGVEFLQNGAIVSDERFRMTLRAMRCLDRNDTLIRQSQDPFMSRTADPVLAQAFNWLEAYFSGQPLPEMPPLSTRKQPEFTGKVIHALESIPFGEHLTYAELAAVIVGEEKAADYARAVGQACSANPYALFVPCHRVLGNRGELVGFSGGIRVKDYLLNHELVTRLEQASRKK